jgi:hypothetical protein
MKPWMIPFLFPIVLLAIVGLIATGVIGQLLALVVGFGVMMFVLSYARGHSRLFGDPNAPADETHYWRMSSLARRRPPS